MCNFHCTFLTVSVVCLWDAHVLNDEVASWFYTVRLTNYKIRADPGIEFRDGVSVEMPAQKLPPS